MDGIERQLEEILVMKLHKNATITDCLKYTQKLTGPIWKLNGVDLVYFLYEIEKHFHVIIPQYEIVSHKFNTIEGISNVLYSIT